MLEREAIEARVGCGAWGVEQGRVAFPQGDDGRVVVEKREQLPIAPDAALVEKRITHAALAKYLFQLGSRSLRRTVKHFQQAAAFGAVVENLFNAEVPVAGFGNA